jgi:hypothetical protein
MRHWETVCLHTWKATLQNLGPQEPAELFRTLRSKSAVYETMDAAAETMKEPRQDCAQWMPRMRCFGHIVLLISSIHYTTKLGL